MLASEEQERIFLFLPRIQERKASSPHTSEDFGERFLIQNFGRFVDCKGIR